MNWKFLEFSERPLSDSCWIVQTAPDGRIYAPCCTEHTGGESATVVRINEASDELEYLFDIDEVTGDMRDSGRATQCKILYSFLPDRECGLLHAATHLSGRRREKLLTTLGRVERMNDGHFQRQM